MRFRRAACRTPERMRQFAGFIFWTAWSAAAETARRHRLLYPQLAVRTAGRQSPHRRERGVDRRQHHHAAGRHLRHGLVVRLAKGRGAGRPDSRHRSPGRLGGHALAARHPQVFLGRFGPHPGADSDGYGHGALRRRRRRLLRHQALAHSSLQRHSHLARADRHLLDRHGLAGRRPVHRPAGQRQGAEVPGARRTHSVRRPARDCGRIAGRRMDEHPEQALRRQRVPLGPSRLRVRRPRPGLADPAVRWPVDLAFPGGSRHRFRRSR